MAKANQRTISRDALYQAYVEDGQTMQQIADRCRVTSASVLRWLRHDDIPTRSRRGGGAAAKIVVDHPNHFRRAGKRSAEVRAVGGFVELAKARVILAEKRRDGGEENDRAMAEEEKPR